MFEERTYPGKLLLFGEYTVINGSNSLAIPFHQLSARWEYLNNNSPSGLLPFYKYLEFTFPGEFDIERMRNEEKKGLYLKSDIPHGYGAGSSGSVVAAVFDRFYLGQAQKSINGLLEIFRKMEDFFHGSSSGIDPLISYTQSAYYSKDGELIPIEYEDLSLLQYTFLYDTKQERSTQILVEIYKERMKSKDYIRQIESQVLPSNNRLIQYFLLNKIDDFFSELKKLEDLHDKLFEDMYPEDIVSEMEVMLSSINYNFKICGAGGGGFFLIFSKDSNAEEKAFSNQLLSIKI